MELVVSPQTLWKFGALERVELGTPIVLVADVVNAALESRYSALREPGAAAGYQVTAGRTLWITRVSFSSSTAAPSALIGSGTADAGDSQIAAPAGAASESSRADGVAAAWGLPAAATTVSFDVLLSIAAGRYPFLRCLSASTSFFALALAVEV